MKIQKKIIFSHIILTLLTFIFLAFYLSLFKETKLAFALFVSIGVSLLAGVFLSIAITRRIKEVTEFSREILSGSLQRKLLGLKDDEIGELGENLNAMAEQLKTRLEALTTDQGILEAVFNSLQDGIMVVDAKGNITLASPSIGKILETSGGIAGRPFFEVLKETSVQDAVTEAKGSGAIAFREIELFHPTNKHLYISVKPLKYKTLGPGFVIVIRDITRLKHLETVRKDFVANVSHELKTPITAIKGFAETLLEGAIDDEENAGKYLEIIKNHSERLNNLVEDLLILSSLDRGEVALNLEPVDVRAIIDMVFLTLKGKASLKSIVLVNNLPIDFPFIRADRNRLVQILLNLVDNAIKFTESGSVVVCGEVKDKLKIIVEDTGVGISSKDTPRLGERFYRVDMARSRALGGTGLGLAIVKHLIQIHGWGMNIESELGKGTRVILTIF
ncbi:MAG: HAMP domain-containing protein [Nitrospirae bacterium]|nr:HAMP domain-containing protein [Nitrospirota bacterium]